MTGSDDRTSLRFAAVYLLCNQDRQKRRGKKGLLDEKFFSSLL